MTRHLRRDKFTSERNTAVNTDPNPAQYHPVTTQLEKGPVLKYSCAAVHCTCLLGGKWTPHDRDTQTSPHPSTRAHLTPRPQYHIFNSGP